MSRVSKRRKVSPAAMPAAPAGPDQVTRIADSLSPAEKEAIFDAIRFMHGDTSLGIRNRVIAGLMLTMGWRAGDLLTRSVSDVLEPDGSVRRRLHIRQQKGSGTGAKAEHQTGEVPDDLRDAIARLVAGRDSREPLICPQGRCEWTVETRVRTDGTTYEVRYGLSYEQLLSLWRTWGKHACPHKRVTTHSPRATVAVEAAAVGGMAAAQAALGHQWRSSTEAYVRYRQHDVNALHAKMRAAFGVRIE